MAQWLMKNPLLNKSYGIKSKNDGPFLAFSDLWFEKYQPYLLFLLNAPILRLWFRWVLRIHKDCKYSDCIIELLPNNYKIKLSDGQIKADFRTHPKYSKRVYFTFRWWWWVLHYLDELFKITIPQLQFGFDTLTAYPDPHPESSTVDGNFTSYVAAGDTFVNMRAANGAGAYDSDAYISAAELESHATNTDNFVRLYRSVFCFGTNIGAGATVSGAVLSLNDYGGLKQSNLGKTTINIASGSTANNTALASADYQNQGHTSFSNVAYDSWSTNVYNNFTLDANGITNLVKTGISKYSAQLGWDIDNSFGGVWSGSKKTRFLCYAADNTGTTTDPKLVLTYTASSIKTVVGVAFASVKTANGVAKASIKKIIGIA